jgi:hypothetical protein
MATSFKKSEVVKTTVCEEVFDALNSKARVAGCDRSEYIRDLIYMDLYGMTFGEHVANHRRSVLGPQGTPQAHQGASI